MSTLYHQFSFFTISGLTQGAIFALIAFGFTIIYRILGLFNFAHGGVFMVGTFVSLLVADGLLHGGLGPLAIVGVILVMVVASGGAGLLLSVGLEYSIFRPIRARGGGGLPALVAGVGALSVMEEIVGLIDGTGPVNVPQPLGNKSLFTVFGGLVQPAELTVFVASILTLLALQRYITVSRMGRALRAVGQDAQTASLMGIATERVVLLTFGLAGATAGLAAALYDIYFGSTNYYAGFDLGLYGLTAALLGGMGSVAGALLGGLVLGLAESYGGAVLGAQWQDVIAFGGLVLILVIRPTGIVGERMALVRA